jgi:hypothetical protein
MPPDEHPDVGNHSTPECRHETGLGRLVAQQLLGKESTGPATRKAENMQGLLRCSPASMPGCRLVQGVCQEGHHTEANVGQEHKRPDRPLGGHVAVDGGERRDHEHSGDRPRRRRFNAQLTSRSSADRVLDRVSPLLAVRSAFHFERQRLANRGAARAGWKRLDVDEDLLPSSSRLDESEAAIVVPGFEVAVESHGWSAAASLRSYRAVQSMPVTVFVQEVEILRDGAAGAAGSSATCRALAALMSFWMHWAKASVFSVNPYRLQDSLALFTYLCSSASRCSLKKLSTLAHPVSPLVTTTAAMLMLMQRDSRDETRLAIGCIRTPSEK